MTDARRARDRTAELPFDPPSGPAPRPPPRVARRPAAPEAVAPTTDLFDLPVRSLDPEQPAAPEPPVTHLAPDDMLLQRIDPRSFRPNERSDAWLYWLTDRERADQALREGLPIDPVAPLLLSERPAVLRLLASMAEDGELPPQSIAVLRLRRIAAIPFLEADREAACYRLSGVRNVSA
jgi:hypothetical protein